MADLQKPNTQTVDFKSQAERFLREGISTQGTKIVIFSCLCRTFHFDYFGPGVKIRMNPRDGGFTEALKLYISSI